MTDREFRRLTREDLLDIIYELQQKTQRLEQENETIRKQLSDRTVKLENAGSIAEAALALNGVFEAAQAAADFVRVCVKRTLEANTPPRNGVEFEPLLGLLAGR